MNHILEKLTEVRQTSEDSWQACCPAHDDGNPSLSITRTEDKILLKCHAGCETEHVVRALGLTMKDLFFKQQPTERLVAKYAYKDLYGQTLYEVLRFEPKAFKQRRPTEYGWIYNMKGVQRILYNLRQVLRAVGERELVYLVEGEKDCDRLNRHGLIATTNAMGAGKWNESYSKTLVGGRVAIIPDEDEPGRRHAEKVAAELQNHGCEVRIVHLPDLPPKGDVSDWLDAGNTPDELKQLVDNTAIWVPCSAPEEPDESFENFSGLDQTDLGNAKLLVKQHGSDIRYCYDMDKWFYYDGTRWRIDDGGEIMRRAKKTVEHLYNELKGLSTEDNYLTKWAIQSASVARLRAMVSLAQSEPGVPIASSEFDLDDWLLNTPNGTIDLRTGELRPHRKEDFITKLAPVEYDPSADSDVLDKFLDRVLPDEDVRQFVQRAAGYSITGSATEEIFLVVHGPGASGKTTLLEAIATALGDYAANASFKTFAKSNSSSSGPNSDLARLRGKRFVKISEIDKGEAFSESLIKQITGGDAIPARFLYGEYFEFIPRFTAWLCVNDAPAARSDDSGLWRRVLQVPFMVSIPPTQRDPQVKRTLMDPVTGGKAVLAWLVQGCLQYQRNGLDVPERVLKATQQYRDSMDPLTEFLDDCCLLNSLARVDNSLLWAEYTSWCEANGAQHRLSQRGLKKRLESKGLVQLRDAKKRYWQGIKLINYRSGHEPVSASRDSLVEEFF